MTEIVHIECAGSVKGVNFSVNLSDTEQLNNNNDQHHHNESMEGYNSKNDDYLDLSF